MRNSGRGGRRCFLRPGRRYRDLREWSLGAADGFHPGQQGQCPRNSKPNWSWTSLSRGQEDLKIEEGNVCITRMYSTPRPAPPPRLPPRPSLSITPIFLPKSIADSDQLEPIERNKWSQIVPRSSLPDSDQLEPVDLSLKRRPSMSVEVEMVTSPRVAPVGLTAVLEKLPHHHHHHH